MAYFAWMTICFISQSSVKLSCIELLMIPWRAPSNTGFLLGIFSGEIYCYANLFCYANFSIVFGPNFRGGGQTVSGGHPCGREPNILTNLCHVL